MSQNQMTPDQTPTNRPSPGQGPQSRPGGVPGAQTPSSDPYKPYGREADDVLLPEEGASSESAGPYSSDSYGGGPQAGTQQGYPQDTSSGWGRGPLQRTAPARRTPRGFKRGLGGVGGLVVFWVLAQVLRGFGGGGASHPSPSYHPSTSAYTVSPSATAQPTGREAIAKRAAENAVVSCALSMDGQGCGSAFSATRPEGQLENARLRFPTRPQLVLTPDPDNPLSYAVSSEPVDFRYSGLLDGKEVTLTQKGVKITGTVLLNADGTVKSASVKGR